ncbi:uncharacterized protein G2W53_022506 [Senna tora]|uniref:Uncharacterized protein n=1 Tax=Senna tora TaxID=362788 RepID=A0A834WIT2_9FABA|nr:uncharacterized protein G2W53_022506 [Senna tora]
MPEKAKRHKGKNIMASGSSSQQQLMDEFFTSEEQRCSTSRQFIIPSPPHGPSNSEVLSAIQHLQCSVNEGFGQVNTRLNEFCT